MGDITETVKTDCMSVVAGREWKQLYSTSASWTEVVLVLVGFILNMLSKKRLQVLIIISF